MLQLLPAPPPPPEYCLLWADRWWPWSDPWWLCMQKGEWSGWAQAIGAIAAIWFAYRIATTTQRAEHRRVAATRRAVADVVKTTLIMQSDTAIRVLQVHRDRWNVPDDSEAGVGHFERDVAALAAIQLPTDDQLERLAQEYPHACQTLVMAKSQFEHLLNMLGWSEGEHRWQRPDATKAKTLLAQSEEVLDYLGRAMTELGLLGGKHGAKHDQSPRKG